MHSGDYCQSLERAELVREGTDVTIFCYSRMRYVVMQAVAQLEKEGFTQTAVEAAVNTIEFSLRCAAGSVGGCHVAAVVCVYLLYLRLLGTWSACCYVIGEPPPRLASSLH